MKTFNPIIAKRAPSWVKADGSIVTYAYYCVRCCAEKPRRGRGVHLRDIDPAGSWLGRCPRCGANGKREFLGRWFEMKLRPAATWLVDIVYHALSGQSYAKAETFTYDLVRAMADSLALMALPEKYWPLERSEAYWHGYSGAIINLGPDAEDALQQITQKYEALIAEYELKEKAA
jgi:hypothetical protein